MLNASSFSALLRPKHGQDYFEFAIHIVIEDEIASFEDQIYFAAILNQHIDSATLPLQSIF